jgi:nucleoside-diphosphate-sugar epimerase
MEYPIKIEDVKELVDLLSAPSDELIELMKRLEGDFIFLGVAGKMGPTMAEMALRASRAAGIERNFYGVSRFSNIAEQEYLERIGIKTIKGDLLDKDFLESLPKAKNVVFLAGMKFGAEQNLSLTWAMNTYLPALVVNTFAESRIVALSTGTVYPLVSVSSGGSLENDKSGAMGEYAQSCLGRERMFEYGSYKHKTPISLIRLNYSVETRYGVIVDIATKVINNQPVDITMGYFNAIWQTDANDMVLRAFEQCSSPAEILNVTGENIISVKYVAAKLGKLLNKKVEFIGKEEDTALLNNASKAFKLFGKPNVSIDRIIEWTAYWINNDRELLGKPTKFEVRNGKY